MALRKYTAAVALIAAVLLLFSGCQTTEQSSHIVLSATREEPLPSESTGKKLNKVSDGNYRYATVAESTALRLEYDAENNCFRIEDKRNGKVWDTIVNAEEKGIRVNELWNQNLSSLFYVTYSVKSSNGQMKSTTVPMRKLEPTVWTEPIANGVRIQYYMPTVRLGFQAEFTLKDNTLQVHIPHESVREDGAVLFVRLDVLPLMGAAAIGEDGYFLLPDGAGTLFHLNSPRYDTSYHFDAYSSLSLDNDVADKLDRDKDSITVGMQNHFSTPLPVYGVQLGDNGFVTYATAGDSDYSINASTGSKSVRFNRIYGQFIMRHIYSFEAGGLTAGDANSLVYETTDQYFVDTDRTLCYTFHCGEDTDYVDMAVAYRSVLQQQGVLKDPITSTSVPMVLNIFMGVKETGIMSGNFMTMTSFEDVQTIVEELRQEGVTNLIVNLKGWNKQGYGAFSKNFPPDDRLGGKAGLKQLLSYCEENSVTLLLESDFVNVDRSYASSEINRGLVKNTIGQIVTSQDKTMAILNPFSALRQFEKFSKKSAAYHLSGVYLTGLGERIYPDYRNNNVAYRMDTISIWKDLLQMATDTYPTVAVSGGNLYTLPYASLLTDIPTVESASAISDESVPFMQIVLHGYIPYTSSAFNSFYDTESQMLKCLEYGVLPLYEITKEPVRNLKNTAYNKLFSASFSAWKEEILSTYSMLNGELASLYASPIADREKLDEALICIHYENGAKLLLNYGETDREVNGQLVKAGNYLLVSHS